MKLLIAAILGLLLLTGCSSINEALDDKPEVDSSGRLVLDTNEKAVNGMTNIKTAMSPHSNEANAAVIELQGRSSLAEQGALTEKQYIAALFKYGKKYCRSIVKRDNALIKEANKYSWEVDNSQQVIDTMIKDFEAITVTAKACSKAKNANQILEKIAIIDTQSLEAVNNLESLTK